MRRSFILFIMLFVTLSVFCAPISQKTAELVAKTFWRQINGYEGTFENVSTQTTFSEFYIFNETNGKGFVMVSGNDLVAPILGYSTSKNFRSENIPENVLSWLSGYEEEIRYAVDNNLDSGKEIEDDWNNLKSGNAMTAKSTRAVSALVQTTWDQGSPYNNLCPYDDTEGERVVTGCVATAMAQIMKYWNYPTSGTGSKSYTHPAYGSQSANFGNTTYQWSNMINSYAGSSSSAQKTAVATLMYHCGVAVEMSYDVSANGGSGAITLGAGVTAESALKNYFLYKNTLQGLYKANYTTTNWVNMLKADINAGRPVLYTGRGDEGGHAFVCDGYDNNNNFHFNWGWSGYYDGFFALTSLNPGTGGAGSGSGTFNESQSAIFNIEPNSGLFAIPNVLDISGLGGNATFMVRSNTSSSSRWNASSNQTWLTLTPTSGNGSGSQTAVTVTAARNNTALERTATITITQGSESATVTVTQPSGLTNGPGCFGNDSYNYFNPLVAGNQIIINADAYGYYESGYQVTSVNFSVCDPAGTDYPTYTNSNFILRIYENGSFDNALTSSGYTTDIATNRGTLVYSQNYTAADFGEQTITLNTPYTITAGRVFWIAIEANGNTLFFNKYIDSGEPIAPANFTSSIAAANGKYLTVDTDNGTNYLNLNNAVLCDSYDEENNCTLYQMATMEYQFSFCIQNPTALFVNPTTLTFDGAGEGKSFTVRANAYNASNWTATSNQTWLTLDQNTGAGSGATATVTATATENLSGTDRNATITVTHGSEVKTIEVSQPDNSVSEPGWYGNSDYNSLFPVDAGYSILIRPENFGNYAEGNKLIKVRFDTYDLASGTYSAYDGSSFTIKVYENSALNSGMTSNGYTSAIDACLGTLVYTQQYDPTDYLVGSQIVDLTTPYVINSNNFWIVVTANENTLFLYEAVAFDTVPAAGFSQNRIGASGNYLYTDINGSTDYLFMNYTSSYTDDTNAYVKEGSAEFALSYYISEDGEYIQYSDLEALFMDDGTSPHYIETTPIELTATDDLVVYPSYINNGPEPTDGDVTISLSVAGTEFDNVTHASTLEAGYFSWIYNSPYSFTVTAAELNEQLIAGTFDVCLTVNYAGADNNTSNNTICRSVTRTTPAFIIAATASPVTGGEIVGAGSYALGNGVTLDAVPNEGYTFVNWTENGTIVSTNHAYSFTATANRTLVANFQINSYTIAATANPTIGGNITGAGTFNYGQTVNLTATANIGYSFVNWTEDENSVSINSNYTFSAIESRTLVANFQINSYTITVNSNGNGTVGGTGTYNYGQEIQISATPSAHYHFVSWNDGNTENPRTITVTNTATYTATFAIDQFEITVSAIGDGTVTGGGVYNYGTTISLLATANEGSHFDSWNDGNTENPRSHYVTESASFISNFVINEAVTYTITATAGENGAITPEGVITITEGSDQSFTIIANANYRIASVLVDDVESLESLVEGVYTFTNVTANHSIEVAFEAIPTYTITATAGANGTITPEGAVTVIEGNDQAFTIVANANYRIASVLIDDVESLESLVEGVYTFTNVTADHSIEVAFESIPTYTITATAGANGTITPEGAVTVIEDNDQSFTIVANANYRIASVLVDEVESLESLVEGVYTFTNVTADHSIEVAFEAIPATHYTITATAGENGTITPEGETTVFEGESLAYSIVPDENYVIDSVIVDGNNAVEYVINSTYTFTNVIENHTIHVTFAPAVSIEDIEISAITLYPNPSNGEFNVQFNNIEGNITYELIGATGNVLEIKNFSVSDNYVKTFDNNLSAGKYFVRIISDENVFVKEFVVE